MQLINRRILFLFGLAVITGVAILGMSLEQGLNNVEQNELTSKTRDRLLLLENTQTKLFEAESAQRAYAFTAEPVFLEEYQVFRRELESYLKRIQASDFSSGSDSSTLNLFLDLIRERLAIMKKLVTARQEQGLQAARQEIASREGKLLMDKIRAVAQQITEQEIAALEQQRTEVLNTAHLQLYLLIAGSLLTLLLLGSAFLITRRELVKSDHLVQRLQHNNQESALVSQLNYSLQSCQSHAEAAEVVRHYMRQLLPDVAGTLYTMRASRNLLQLATSWNPDMASTQFLDPIEPHDCWALRLGRTQVITPGSNEMFCSHYDGAMPDKGGYICVPMQAQSEIVGLLHLQAKTDNNMDTLRDKAENLAAQIGAAIASLSLRESLRMQNVRDPLTNLYNRRYLEETMERERLRALRNHGSFGMIMLDIDHFKQFNDTHGHQAGDEALQLVAKALQQNIRGEDIACRYGGEEFLLVLPGMTLEQTRERAELLRERIENTTISVRGQELPDITSSIGVAAYPEHGDEWETVMHLADAALYRAKRAGRNRVEIGESPQAKHAIQSS